MSENHDIISDIENVLEKVQNCKFKILKCISANEFTKNVQHGSNDLLLITDMIYSWDDFYQLENIINNNPGIKVVIYSSNRDFVNKGYEIGIYRYIDINNNNKTKYLYDAIFQYTFNKLPHTSLIRFDFKEGNIELSSGDILYIEKSNHDVLFHLKNDNKVLHKRGSLADVYSKLQGCDFIKVHRGYIVNLRYVKSINNLKIYLISGKMIPVSKRDYRIVKDKINDFKKDNFLKRYK